VPHLARDITFFHGPAKRRVRQCKAAHGFTNHIFGLSWDPASVTLTVLLVLFFLTFLFLFLALTAQPVQGPTSVPPTAAEAAKMPRIPLPAVFLTRREGPVWAGLMLRGSRAAGRPQSQPPAGTV
jgi:hypothetical protein